MLTPSQYKEHVSSLDNFQILNFLMDERLLHREFRY
jgi:hypothetical protein